MNYDGRVVAPSVGHRLILACQEGSAAAPGFAENGGSKRKGKRTREVTFFGGRPLGEPKPVRARPFAREGAEPKISNSHTISVTYITLIASPVFAPGNTNLIGNQSGCVSKNGIWK